MLPRCLALLIGLFYASTTFAQSVPEPPRANRVVPLQEYVHSEKPLKHYRHKARTQQGYWHFGLGASAHFPKFDSTFYLTNVPALSTGPIRLREIRLRLKPWDTTKMRLNLMVIQMRNGDTNYSVLPLRMDVRNDRLVVRIDDLGFPLDGGEFFLGYSLAAFNVPEEFTYRVYARWTASFGSGVRISNGALQMLGHDGMRLIFPYELAYDNVARKMG